MPGNTILLISKDAAAGPTLAALRRGEHQTVTLSVEDGKIAVQYLESSGNFVGNPKPEPCQIIVETPSPDYRAVALLQTLRSLRQKPRVPIVVLCEQATEEEIDDCYGCGANSVLVSSGSTEERAQAAEGLLTYWVELNCVSLTHA